MHMDKIVQLLLTGHHRDHILRIAGHRIPRRGGRHASDLNLRTDLLRQGGCSGTGNQLVMRRLKAVLRAQLILGRHHARAQ